MNRFCQELGCFIPLDQTSGEHRFCRKHSECSFSRLVEFSSCSVCSNLVSNIVDPTTHWVTKQDSKTALCSWISGFDDKIASAGQIIEYMLEIPFEDVVEPSSKGLPQEEESLSYSRKCKFQSIHHNVGKNFFP